MIRLPPRVLQSSRDISVLKQRVIAQNLLRYGRINGNSPQLNHGSPCAARLKSQCRTTRTGPNQPAVGLDGRPPRPLPETSPFTLDHLLT